LTRAHKIGMVVITLPGIAVAALSLLAERWHPQTTQLSAWQRVAPLLLAWAIGLLLVGGSFLLVRWIAARGQAPGPPGESAGQSPQPDANAPS